MKVATIALLSCSIFLRDQAAAFAPQSRNHSPRPSCQNTLTSSSSITTSSLNAVENAVTSAPDILLAAGAALTTVGAAAAAALGKLPSFGKSSSLDGLNGDAIRKGNDAAPQIIDVTIPYDAASRLAFESYPEKDGVDFAQFQMLYESQMVAEVKAKVQERKVREMQLALDELEKDVAEIQLQIEELFRPTTTVDEETVVDGSASDSASGIPVDLSIEYDAAAKLAYEASDKTMGFAAFRARYVEETVAMVSAKKAERGANN